VTMTMFLSLSQLNIQHFVYFAQNLQQTFQNVTSTISLNLTAASTDYSIYFYPMLWSNISQYNIPCANFLSPTRAETLNIGAMVFMMILYVVTFLVGLLFSQSQPLKSRGISPFGTMIFLIVDLGLEFQNWAPLSFLQQSLCLSQAYGIYPLEQTCFVMIFLYFIRYFSIIRINTLKNNVKVEEVGGRMVTTVAWYLRLLKLMSHLWFIFFLIVLYILFAMLLNTIVILATNSEFLCEFVTLVNLSIIAGVQLMVVYFLTTLLLIGDLVSNQNLLRRCDWFSYIFKMDPFYFRLQIALFVPYMIYNCVSELYLLIAIQSFPDLIYTVTQTETLNTVNFDILFLIDVVLPLSITIISVIINLFLEEEAQDNDLVKLLKDKKGRDLFETYVKKEYAVENLYCWIDITLRSLTEPLKRRCYLSIHAKRICDKYFKGDKSLMEVNVTKKETDLLWRKLKQKKVDSQIFDRIFGDHQGEFM